MGIATDISTSALDAKWLATLVDQGESVRMEFASNAIREAVVRTAVAFLNAQGGTLIIGVRDNEQHEVIGIENAKRIASEIADWLAKEITPRAAITTAVVRLADAEVVVVDVPEGSESPYLHKHVIFIRKGTRTVPATTEDIVGLVARRQGESDRWERRAAAGVTLRDLSEEEVMLTAERAATQRLTNLGSGMVEVLEQLNVVGNGAVRNSGVILFGKKPGQFFPQTQVRIVRFESDADIDHLEDNRVLEGNIFQLIEKVNDVLATHIPIRARIQQSSFQREESPAYPMTALREAIINAFAHRDYASYTGSIVIKLFPNRLEVWNPGSLPEGLSISDLADGAVSRPHNPDIAYVLFLRGLVERLGTGTRRIIDACREGGLPLPRWEQVGGGIRLSIFLRDAKRAGSKALNERMDRFVQSTKPDEHITAATYHSAFAPDISERAARTDLAKLVDLGYLKKIRRGRGTHYIRTRQQLPI